MLKNMIIMPLLVKKNIPVQGDLEDLGVLKGILSILEMDTYIPEPAVLQK